MSWKLKKKKHVRAFECEAGHRIISCMCGKTSVMSQKSVEKPENGAVEWTKASASLCRNKALVETLDLYAISLI